MMANVTLLAGHRVASARHRVNSNILSSFLLTLIAAFLCLTNYRNKIYFSPLLSCDRKDA